MVIVPSRDHVGSYAELKTKIDEEIGSINGRYSTMNWTPVCYFYHGFSLEELTAMYYVADIAPRHSTSGRNESGSQRIRSYQMRQSRCTYP